MPKKVKINNIRINNIRQSFAPASRAEATGLPQQATLKKRLGEKIIADLQALVEISKSKIDLYDENDILKDEIQNFIFIIRPKEWQDIIPKINQHLKSIKNKVEFEKAISKIIYDYIEDMSQKSKITKKPCLLHESSGILLLFIETCGNLSLLYRAFFLDNVMDILYSLGNWYTEKYNKTSEKYDINKDLLYFEMANNYLQGSRNRMVNLINILSNNKPAFTLFKNISKDVIELDLKISIKLIELFLKRFEVQLNFNDLETIQATINFLQLEINSVDKNLLEQPEKYQEQRLQEFIAFFNKQKKTMQELTQRSKEKIRLNPNCKPNYPLPPTPQSEPTPQENPAPFDFLAELEKSMAKQSINIKPQTRPPLQHNFNAQEAEKWLTKRFNKSSQEPGVVIWSDIWLEKINQEQHKKQEILKEQEEIDKLAASIEEDNPNNSNNSNNYKSHKSQSRKKI